MDMEKIDIAEVAERAESAGEELKKSLDMEKRMFHEILPRDLENPNFILPTMIRITGITEKFSGLNAIGYLSEYKDFRVLNVFRERIDEYKIRFYPSDEGELYYADPADFNRYIALDEYFGYLKTARLEELQQIVESLGAKRYQITYLFQKPFFASEKKESGLKLLGRLFDKKPAEIVVKRGLEEEDIEHMEIIAGSEGEGHDPEEPELHYLKKDPSVQTLISQRMDANATEPQQKYILKLIDSCGIKPGTAAKIDIAMKDMKFSGNTTVTAEARNESRRYLVLEAEF